MLVAMVLGLALVGQSAEKPGAAQKATREAAKPTGVADKVTLRDGTNLAGSIVEIIPRGPVVMILRRDWVRVNAPAWYEKWAKLDAPQAEEAAKVRADRLKAWRDQRAISPDPNDRISAWIDRELDALKAPGLANQSPLIQVKVPRNEVRSMTRQPRGGNSALLRQAWAASLREPEAMSPETLTSALEGKGFLVDKEKPVNLEHMLPLGLEPEAQWLVRRAATEVSNDLGNRFLRYQDALMPEPAPGEAPPAGAGIQAALGSLKELLGEPTRDPVPDALRGLTRKGKTGAIVTRLTIAADLDHVTVERMLWVRSTGENWMAAASRTATVRPGNLPAQAGQNLAADPQIQVAFSVVESLGLGQVSEEMKQKSLNVGAATRMALGQARTGLEEALRPYVLPVTERAAIGKP